MKVGDLVRIKEWCKGKGKLAIVSEVSTWSGDELKIQILDQDYKEIWARSKNLELIEDPDAVKNRRHSYQVLRS
ncbi:MAG: hypothetical protein CMO97_05155 [Woeseia sp.]|nr:hypothetical protein [Woeseia sp.]|tara:strand:+ start:626 stop:847 length:222 start_codon:yes stop_codon:yes gene_type:complete